ncbi:hypothetical protein AWR27_10450 [Spirosoma montaniterrae]|uniref:Outer membrane protein beta-barrel domain-containing protein n=2 Tax=Spirosoma montaniterrae TaxID=1178516 RepID=A0A1P9WWF8_9BACT|nr:hypothetical protein AWR27_10450 [Spirosoma montaniterrae]
MVSPDSTPAQRPTSLTFSAQTDQRFFYFNDTRNSDDRRVPVNVWGVQAGFLFPLKRPRPGLTNGRPVGFRAGVGFFFTNQTIDQPGLLPNTSESITRRLRYATLNYEPFVFRHKTFEVSLPLEIGYGWSRYEHTHERPNEPELAKGHFIPAGVGVGLSYMFPHPRWFRPLRWFGVNFLAGHRFTLKRDIPASQINYNGWYMSVGPAFFLENFTADYKRWRQKRKKKE